MHQFATPAAFAAMAAAEQGKFWEYHDKLFANQQKLGRDDLLKYAREVKLDVKAFEAALTNPQIAAKVDADKKEATALGISGTPAFFVNGRFLSGAKPFEGFAQVINAELARMNLPIPPAAQQAAPPAGVPVPLPGPAAPRP